MEAHLLSLDNFSKPKVLEASNAAYVNIIYLLLLSKGKYQSHPDMGVGLRERYRYNNDINFLSTLQSDIKNQISQYLPELSIVDVSVNMRSDHILGIIIDTNDGSYVMAYDSKSEKIDAAASYILNDL